MTTYVFANGLLAADTRISRDGPDGAPIEVGRTNKISVSPLRAWVGAGRTRALFFLSLLPNLLALRWLGWGLVPTNRFYEEGEVAALYVVWRNGLVWNIEVRLRKVRGVWFAQRTEIFAEHSRINRIFSKGGSGAGHFTIDELCARGPEHAIFQAAAHDPGTSAQPIVFDTHNWCYTLPVPKFPLVDGTAAHGIALWAAWFFALPPKPSFLADVLAPWADMARWVWRTAGRMLS